MPTFINNLNPIAFLPLDGALLAKINGGDDKYITRESLTDTIFSPNYNIFKIPTNTSGASELYYLGKINTTANFNDPAEKGYIDIEVTGLIDRTAKQSTGELSAPYGVRLAVRCYDGLINFAQDMQTNFYGGSGTGTEQGRLLVVEDSGDLFIYLEVPDQCGPLVRFLYSENPIAAPVKQLTGYTGTLAFATNSNNNNNRSKGLALNLSGTSERFLHTAVIEDAVFTLLADLFTSALMATGEGRLLPNIGDSITVSGGARNSAGTLLASVSRVVFYSATSFRFYGVNDSGFISSFDVTQGVTTSVINISISW